MLPFPPNPTTPVILYGSTGANTSAQCLLQAALDVPAATPLSYLTDLANFMLLLLAGLPPAVSPANAPVSGDLPGSRVFSLSAPQYGVGPLLQIPNPPAYNGLQWRFFVLHRQRLDDVGIGAPGSGPLVFINPVVEDIDNDDWSNLLFEECLSTPPTGGRTDLLVQRRPVGRSVSIALTYHDLSTWGSGPPSTTTFTGELAHLIQHELGHLNGMMSFSQWEPAELQDKAAEIYGAWYDHPNSSLSYPYFRL